MSNFGCRKLAVVSLRNELIKLLFWCIHGLKKNRTVLLMSVEPTSTVTIDAREFALPKF